MIIILLGPPGSGKGTISEQLRREFDFFHLAPGELLREEVAKQTTIGKEIKKYIEQGLLVPDNLVVEIVRLELHGKQKVLLDGFPRTVAQAKAIANLHLDKVLLLQIPEKKVIERFSGRRVCTKNHGYHLKYLPPKHPDTCDKDGLPLTARKDDDPKVIKERFRVYHQETQPLIDYYQKKNLLTVVDASLSPPEVYTAVKKSLFEKA